MGNNFKEFIKYAKQRSIESKGTSYEWDFNKFYPTENDEDFFIEVIRSCPYKTMTIENEHCWAELIDWFENEPLY